MSRHLSERLVLLSVSRIETYLKMRSELASVRSTVSSGDKPYCSSANVGLEMKSDSSVKAA